MFFFIFFPELFKSLIKPNKIAFLTLVRDGTQCSIPVAHGDVLTFLHTWKCSFKKMKLIILAPILTGALFSKQQYKKS